MLGVAKGLLAGVVAIIFLTGVARADIVIAVAGPMTGQFAQFGEQLRRGARQAVDDINQRGGVLGQTVDLRVVDDVCDPALAVALANQLVNAGVVFVDGHFCSGSSIPASQIYHEADILQISPASTNPQLTEQGFVNVFRVSGRDDQQGAIAADHVIDNQLGNRIAVVDDGSAYGRTLADAFRAELNRRSVQELLNQRIAAGQSDFMTLIDELARLRIDLVYFGGFHTEAALLIRQAAERGLAIQLLSGDALATDEFLAIAGAAGEGTLLTFGPDVRRNRAAASVVREFIDQGYDPAGHTLYSYAAIQVWAQAVEAAGTTALAPVVEQLRSGRFATVLGTVRFDAKGDIRGPNYVLYRWSDGRLVEVTRRVRIEARAFVPGAFVRSPLDACEGGVVFRGDRRIDRNGDAIFTPDARRFVMRQVVDVLAQRDEDGFTLEVMPKKAQVKPTVEYALDALADGRLNRQDNDAVMNDCRLRNRRATATARGLEVASEPVADEAVLVHIRGGVRNPLLPRGSPRLGWDLEVRIDFSLDEPGYRVRGSHDGFPAFEVYINDVLAYGFDPGAPACELEVEGRALASYCAGQLNRPSVRIGRQTGPIALGR